MLLQALNGLALANTPSNWPDKGLNPKGEINIYIPFGNYAASLAGEWINNIWD